SAKKPQHMVIIRLIGDYDGFQVIEAELELKIGVVSCSELTRAYKRERTARA
ncbi:hypothetical protein CCACVL1_00399, partial [Corchorus capsularis]